MTDDRARCGLATILLAAIVLTGCTSNVPSTSDCTLVGALRGLGVTVEADVAPVSALRLEVCVDGTCEQHDVALGRGTTTVGESCDDAGPDGTCSARSEFDGTQVGFVEVDLPVGDIEVSGSYRRDGAVVAVAAATVEAEASYPNGPDCAPDGNQATVVIGADGLVDG